MSDPSTRTNADCLADYDVVLAAVRNRRTCKILADPAQPLDIPLEIADPWNRLVRQSIAAAGLAPFHYQRNHQGVVEPWRAYFLDWSSCRQLARKFPGWFSLKPSNKIPSMLSACGSLILVTWIPQFREGAESLQDVSNEKQIEIDDEHLAAAAAMVQNILLLLTAAGLETYWSSGGELGSATCFGRLGIDSREKLLAAVFVGYPLSQETGLQRIEGKNHQLRSAVELWSRSLRVAAESGESGADVWSGRI